MIELDVVRRFYFPQLHVRAVWARLSETHQKLHSLSRAPEPVQQLLTKAACAAAILQTGLKGVARVGVQLQSQGPLRLLFAECTDQGALRGIARIAEDAEFTSDPWQQIDGILALNLEPHRGERYQGLVALDPAGLTESFERYFADSEQLPTLLMLASDARHTTGLLLQKVASAGGVSVHDERAENCESASGAKATPIQDQDGWSRIAHLYASLQEQELSDCDADTVMHRLFHQEQIEAYTPRGLHHHCSCSRERVGSMLQSLGRAEAALAAEPSGFASIVCEFCNEDYKFDRVDIEALFHAELGESLKASNQSVDSVQ